MNGVHLSHPVVHRESLANCKFIQEQKNVSVPLLLEMFSSAKFGVDVDNPTFAYFLFS